MKDEVRNSVENLIIQGEDRRLYCESQILCLFVFGTVS